MESLAETRHILKIRIQSHPVTMKEIVEFGLEHRVDSSQLQTVRDEVDAMKRLTKDMAATVAKAERANLALTEKLNKAHQDLGKADK